MSGRRRLLALVALSLGAPRLAADPPAGPAPAAPTSPPPTAAAPASPAVARRDLSATVAEIRARHDVPALCGGLVVGPDLVAWGVDGVRARGSDVKATLQDRWHLGSCTKAMTATLCALLVEEQALSWGTTLAQALTPQALADWNAHSAWSQVTLQQLLTHRAGMPQDLSGDGLWGRLWARQGTPGAQREQLLRGVLVHEPLHAPGTGFLYSNAGFAIAGLLAERAAQEPYEALLTRRLFVPLGMASAGFGPPGSADAIDQPRGHDAQGRPIVGVAADNPPAIAPAGTVHCSLEDWARFVSLHLEGREGRSKLLPRAAFARLHEPARGPGAPYACGWSVLERSWGGTVLTHNGSNTMWYCVAWLAPERGFGVLALANAAGDAATKACDELAFALIQARVPPRKR